MLLKMHQAKIPSNPKQNRRHPRTSVIPVLPSSPRRRGPKPQLIVIPALPSSPRRRRPKPQLIVIPALPSSPRRREPKPLPSSPHFRHLREGGDLNPNSSSSPHFRHLREGGDLDHRNAVYAKLMKSKPGFGLLKPAFE
jgi:hypothetical protein